MTYLPKLKPDPKWQKEKEQNLPKAMTNYIEKNKVVPLGKKQPEKTDWKSSTRCCTVF